MTWYSSVADIPAQPEDQLEIAASQTMPRRRADRLWMIYYFAGVPFLLCIAVLAAAATTMHALAGAYPVLGAALLAAIMLIVLAVSIWRSGIEVRGVLLRRRPFGTWRRAVRLDQLARVSYRQWS